MINMRPETTLARLCIILAASLLGVVDGAFNLNTVGPDWSYTADLLAGSTSQRCKDAYSANVDCDYTLVGLVASSRFPFDPTEADLGRTCTKTCEVALEAYVKGVKDACTESGDRAWETPLGGMEIYEGAAPDYAKYTLIPVDTIGKIFQYIYAISCTKNLADGKFCHFETQRFIRDFACDDVCWTNFYQAAHDLEGAHTRFIMYWMIHQTTWWENEFATGWKRVQDCANGDITSVPTRARASLFLTAPASYTRHESKPLPGTAGSDANSEVSTATDSAGSASTQSSSTSSIITTGAGGSTTTSVTSSPSPTSTPTPATQAPPSSGNRVQATTLLVVGSALFLCTYLSI